MFPGTTMLNYFFWMVCGALQVLVVMGGYAWLKSYGKKVAWWQMTLMYLCFASICGVIAGGTTLMGEYETIGGWYFIGFLGVPIIIAGAILFKVFVLKSASSAR